MTLSISIADVFHVQGQGTVLSGVIKIGTVAAGQRVSIQAPAESAEARIVGIEVNKELVSEASIGQQVGLMFQNLVPETLPSGFQRLENGGYSVTEISIVNLQRPWWRFW